MKLNFKNLTNLWNTELAHIASSDMKIFDKICKDYNFVAGAKIQSLYFSSEGLLDHTFVFKDKDGKRYVVTNPYLDRETIINMLEAIGLTDDATILGPGFWNDSTTAILLSYEPINEISRYGYLKSLGKEEYVKRIEESRYAAYLQSPKITITET